ncbi:hypothetical protein [Azospirillum sp. sgz302134]
MAPASRILTAAAVLIAVLIGVLAGTLALSAPASAQFNMLFGGRGGKTFTSEDWTIFKDTMRQLLDSGKAGSRADWRNEQSGFHGDMRVERVYQREGLPCRHVAFNVMRAKERVPYRMNFCKTDEGNWVIAP